MEKRKILKVEWMDAQIIGKSIGIDEIEKGGLVPVVTIGYLLHENKERIVICSWIYGTNSIREMEGFNDVHTFQSPKLKK